MRPGAMAALAAAFLATVPAVSRAEVHLRTRTITPASAVVSEAVPGTTETLVAAAAGPVSAAWKASLESAGAHLVVYLPDRAFLVRVAAGRSASLRKLEGTEFVASLLPGDKVAPEMAGALDARGELGLPIHVLVAPDVAAARVAAAARELGLKVLGAQDGGPTNDLSVELPPGRLDLAEALSRRADVLWLEPRARRVLLNDSSMYVGQSGLAGQLATPIFDHGIRGTGTTVAVLDTGLDYDMCYFRDPAEPPAVNVNGALLFNPRARKVVAYDMLWSADDPANPGDYDNHGHGTHVCGSVAGDDDTRPLVHDLADGMAPGAKLVMQDGGFDMGDNCADLPGIGCPVVDLTPIFDQAYQQGARIHSNSWGDRENFNPQNTYTAACVDTDDFMYTHPDFLLVYAAGNSGPGNNTVGSPSVAKDTLSVGATNRGGAAQTLAGFSSRGYAADGRFKPTVTAPGVNIASADNDGDITTGNCGNVAFSGTSMACPTAAGLSALVRQYYMDGFYPGGVANAANGFVPSAALVKATVVNSGKSMTGETAIPSRGQGFGRITLADTLLFEKDPRSLLAVDDGSGFATGDTVARTRDVVVLDSSAPLKVTLVWTDPPSTPMAATNLINDLDLTVTGPSGTFLGNVFAAGVSTTGGTPDARNVEEEVLIAAPQPGTYTIAVTPRAVPSGPQPFALVATGVLAARTLALKAVSETVVSDSNGNGWVDPNERARLSITLRNVSEVAATGVTARLVSTVPDVTVTDADAAFADLAPGATGTSLPDHFEVLAAPDLACGTKVTMQLEITASGTTYTELFDLLIGGYATVWSEAFDTVAQGQLPATWQFTGSGAGVADASVEPAATSPGPVSPPNALFVGKTANDMARTLGGVSAPIDLGPWVGRSPILSFRWWTYLPEANDRLVVSLSDSGTGAFPYYGFWAEAFDSATQGGNQWGNTSIELSAIPGFVVGAQDAVRFEASVNRNEAGGDGFYVDDVAVRAIKCDPAPCTEAVADTTGSGPLVLCTPGPVTLDGSQSTLGGACSIPELQWYEGTTPLAPGPVAVVSPTASTTYRLEVRCAAPISCVGTATVDVVVGGGGNSSITADTLRAVRRGAAVEMTWVGVGSGFNVSSVLLKTLVPALVTTPPLNPAPVPAPTYTDTPASNPITYYSAFGTDCSGASVP